MTAGNNLAVAGVGRGEWSGLSASLPAGRRHV